MLGAFIKNQTQSANISKPPSESIDFNLNFPTFSKSTRFRRSSEDDDDEDERNKKRKRKRSPRR